MYKRQAKGSSNNKIFGSLIKAIAITSFFFCPPDKCLALTFNNQIYETGTANLIFVKNNKLFSPKKNFYKGITLKFFDNKFNINYSNIHLKNLKDFSEIILVGSGKGVISVTNVQGMIWRRKSLKHYKILKKYYEKAVTKCPRYYS